MNRSYIARALPVFLLAAAVLAPAGVWAETSSDAYYIENEWNYVDGSMEVDEGIPKKASGDLGRIRQAGVLKVAVDPSHAPYCFRTSKEGEGTDLAGADLELARRIADKMGVELSLLPMDSLQLLPALTEDQCDLSISAISFTPSRALSYALSKAYWLPEEEVSIGLLLREEDLDQFTDLEDLAEKILVVQANSLAETVGVRQLTTYQEFRRLGSAKAVYEAVEKKTAFAGLVDQARAAAYFQSHPDCHLTLAEGLAFSPANQYLGLRVAGKKGENELLYFVNGVIDEVLEDGSYEEWLLAAKDQDQ